MIGLIAATFVASISCGPDRGDCTITNMDDPRQYRHDHKSCEVHTLDRRDFRPTVAGAVGGGLFGAVGGALANGGDDHADKTARWNARIEACMEAKGYPPEVPH